MRNRGLASLILLLLVLAVPAWAEFEDKHAGVRASAMGGAYAAVGTDAEAVFYNPAGIAQNSSVAELSSMHTTLFGQEELSYDYVTYSQPLMPFAIVQMAVQTFGGTMYKERSSSLTIAREIADRYYLGGTVKNLRTQIVDTPDASSFSGDLGMMIRFENNFKLGFAVLDFNNPRVNDVVPRTTRVGLSFKPVEALELALDWSKRRDEKVGSFHLGEEFKLNDMFYLRAGWVSRPSRVTVGFGIHVHSLRVNYAFRNHEDLDNTHRVSASLTF